jgi:hypothetical protein
MLEDRRLLSAGPYPPAAGQPGSTAIHMDDPMFVQWADGWENYVAGEGVIETWQTPQKALGKAVGDATDVVSLGRGGEITLTFDSPIRNGPSWDFAVFENAVTDAFLELGYVEVSSDGTNFFRFPNDSQTADPVPAFGVVDPANITGYAGKYRQGYGTPFDMDDLVGVSPLLDVNHISHVRIVDITGDGTYLDSDGDVIYDPYPTAESAGVDLDAVGVIHAVQYAESTVGFEDVGAGLPSEGHWNGPDPDGVEQTGPYGDLVVVGSFFSGGLDFNNTYSLDYGNWSGWAYSNETDTTTPGFDNQFSAYAGSGAEGSPTFGVAFAGTAQDVAKIELTPDTEGMVFRSLAVTNTTYAALSMRDGDAFAKRFGGTSGDDPDWFLLTIVGRDAGGSSVGHVEFYLADYRFADNSKDYIVDDWTTVDVSDLRTATSLEFQLTSSDVGTWGMNTPAFVAVDNIVLGRERVPIDLSTSSISEGAGPAATVATVSRTDEDTSNPLTVTLHSNDTSEVTAPASVTIPAGQSSVQFDVAAVDDDIVDGTQTVTLTASATSYASGAATLDVTDDDLLRLTLSIADPSVSEGAGTTATTGTVSRNDGDLSHPLTVALTSDDNNVATVPASVTIPANQSSVQFAIAAVDDAIVDGTQSVSISATATDYVADSKTLEVTDDDLPTLTVSIERASVSEGAGAAAATGTVSRNDSDLADPLIVTLSSDDLSGATVPSSVEIPSNQSSAQFVIEAIDDSVVDGPQTVTVTAAATGYVDGTDDVEVTDDDVLTLTLSIEDSSVAETAGGAATTATIRRNDGDLSKALTVTLSSDDTSAVSLPSSAVIPANKSSVQFDIAAVDDSIVDGIQTVTITASATDYVSGEVALSVTDDDTLELTLLIAESSVSEGAGATATTGTVSRNDGDLSDPLTVTLVSDDTNVATVPASVTILENESSVPFAIATVDDSVVDGTQTVSITATATDYVADSKVLVVTDDDSLRLTLSIEDSSISEGAGAEATTGIVSRNDKDLSNALTVTLSSDDVSRLTVPSTLVIPAHQVSAQFDIGAVGDSLVDGAQIVTITASATDYVDGTDTLQVTDDDVLTLTLSMDDSSVSEAAGAEATTGTVRRNDGDLSDPLTVTLTSDDVSAATVPASITIPENEASVQFAIASVDDGLVDGPQDVSIVATAIDYVADSEALQVTDDDTLTLTVTIAPGSVGEADAPPTARMEAVGATLGEESYWNGSDGSGGFESDGLVFNNDYNATWDSWTGWSYSNTIDTTTPGYTNQYSARTGAGALGSRTYAVANVYSGGAPPTVELTAATAGLNFQSLMVTNTTYAALSMRDGDVFAKQFGGVDGSDPDWFLLTIEGFDGSGNSVGTVDFYLADYRSSDPAEDYIVDAWTELDVSSLASATKLGFSLSSSDVGMFGMNTPAYFAVDNIVLSGPAAATGTVFRNDGDLSGALDVTLASTDVSEATVPPSVTIPAGQASAEFPIAAVNDAVVDGTQTVTISGLATGYESGSDTLHVTDDDVLTLTVTLAATNISEAAGANATTGVVRHNDADLSRPVTVTLTSTNTSEATVPARVTIPAGQASAQFSVDAVDDSLLDGAQEVVIKAASEGYVDDNGALTVTDREELTLVIADNVINEKGGFTTATVTRTDTSGDLVVDLLVSDDTEAELPMSIVIPDGQATSAALKVTALEDNDGIQTVVITASATGYVDGSDTVDVAEYMSWQSYTHPCDVDVDGWIVPLDVLLVIDDINGYGTRELPSPYTTMEAPPPYVDVSGNQVLSGEDILLVILYLNAYGAGPVPTGPSTAAPTGTPVPPAAEGEYDGVAESPSSRRDIVISPSPLADDLERIRFAAPRPRLNPEPELLAPEPVSPSDLEEILDVISADVNQAWKDLPWSQITTSCPY